MDIDNKLKDLDLEFLHGVRVVVDPNLMTGREWYEKFTAEAQKIEGYSDDEAFAMYRELVAVASNISSVE